MTQYEEYERKQYLQFLEKVRREEEMVRTGKLVRKEAVAPFDPISAMIREGIQQGLLKGKRATTTGVKLNDRYCSGVWVDDKIVKNMFITDNGVKRQLIRTTNDFTDFNTIVDNVSLWENTIETTFHGIKKGFLVTYGDSQATINFTGRCRILDLQLSFQILRGGGNIAEQDNTLFTLTTEIAKKSFVMRIKEVKNDVQLFVEIGFENDIKTSPFYKNDDEMFLNIQYNNVTHMYEYNFANLVDGQFAFPRPTPFRFTLELKPTNTRTPYVVADMKSALWENGDFI